MSVTYTCCLTWIIRVKPYDGVTTVGHGYRILERCPRQFSTYRALPVQFLHLGGGDILAYLLHGHDAELITVKVKRMIRVVRNTYIENNN